MSFVIGTMAAMIAKIYWHISQKQNLNDMEKQGPLETCVNDDDLMHIPHHLPIQSRSNTSTNIKTRGHLPSNASTSSLTTQATLSEESNDIGSREIGSGEIGSDIQT